MPLLSIAAAGSSGWIRRRAPVATSIAHSDWAAGYLNELGQLPTMISVASPVQVGS